MVSEFDLTLDLLDDAKNPFTGKKSGFRVSWFHRVVASSDSFDSSMKRLQTYGETDNSEEDAKV